MIGGSIITPDGLDHIACLAGISSLLLADPGINFYSLVLAR